MKRLLKSAAGTFGLRIFYTLLTFVTSFILARSLGTSGFGIYTYATSWAYLLAVPASLGFPGLISKETAIYQTKSTWSYLSGLLKWSQSLSLLVSVSLALAASALAWHFNRESNPELTIAFGIAMVSLPWVSCRNINRGVMKGSRKVFTGLLPEMLVGPLIIVTAIACGWLVLKDAFSPIFAVGIYSLSACLTAPLSIVLRRRILPSVVKQTSPQYQRRYWLNAAWPYMIIESLLVINAQIDIIMLGALSGVASAGVYAPVNRGANLLSFVLMAFGANLAPTVASLYSEGKKEELQKIFKKSVRIVMMISGVLSLCLFSFAYQYLQIFGQEFTDGIIALRIFCIGRFIYSCFGLSPMLLSMTGHSRLTATGGMIAMGMNILLNFILIPIYGINGAAIATVTSSITLGIFDERWAVRKTGISPTFIGKVR